MRNKETEEKMTEITIKKGIVRINRNRMATLSLGSILVDWYAVNHIESPTTNEKTFMASMGVIMVVSFVQACISHHKMICLEEEYQKCQSVPSQKSKDKK